LREHHLRDLDDEINKLIREKGHWEVRILELGGLDYAKVGPEVTDSEGKEVSHKSQGSVYLVGSFFFFFP
jgi:pre-mRNA-splicing factor ISY1